MNNKKNILLYVILTMLLIVGFLATQSSKSRLIISNLSHRIFQPDDLFQPIIFEKFDFSKVDTTSTFVFNPKYYDTYSLSLVVKDSEYDGSIDFNGVLKIEVYADDEKILDKYARGTVAKLLGLQDGGYRQSDILTFNIPFRNFKRRDLKLRVNIEDPSTQLEGVSEKLYLKVAVSSIP